MAFVLLASCLVAVATAPAKSNSEKLEAVEEKIGAVEEREGVLTSDIEAMGEEISALESQVSALRNQEAAAEEELAAKQAELERAEAELRKALDRLETLRGRLKRALIVLRERLVAIYTYGSTDITSVVLSAEDFGDMVARTEYFDAINESDSKLAERVRELRDEAKKLVGPGPQGLETDDRKGARPDRRQGAAARSDPLDAGVPRGRPARGAGGAAPDAEGHRRRAPRARGDRRRPAGRDRPGNRRSDRRVPAAGRADAEPERGRLHLADRRHPHLRVRLPLGTDARGHRHRRAGRDADPRLGLGHRDPDAVRVRNGYGNYTCLDHGGGLATCYAHQSSFATSSGASVSQGDLIGYVGNTGHSYGAHLHFEVRINGAATDPLGYL